MIYRTNAYVAPPLPIRYQPNRLDLLSYKLVGHYCLFTNMATGLASIIPILGGIFLAGYLLYKMAYLCYKIAYWLP